MQEDISFSDVYQILKRHSKVILLSIATSLIISTILVLFVIEPQYVSKAQLLVGNDNNQQEVNEEVDQTIDRNISLINTYTDIVEGTSVLNEVAERLDNQYSIREIQAAIQVEHSFNSQLFSITATMSEPQAAQELLEAVVVAFNHRVEEIYGADNALVQNISSASYSPNKAAPNELFISLVGLMFGVSIGVLIAFGLELRETAVVDEDIFIEMNILQLGKIYDMED